ncbi:MAG: cytochrome b/b6 domain-containing protein [Hydrogenophaga sp.]|nr:cytochrome b/b6 domain-containing protein [Hydrogenophaga sp.]
MHPLRVWDLPTRLFHWLLALLVAGLLITGNIGGNWMVWHFRFGYAVLSLLLFRLVWGFAGGHWSRFGQFVYGPGTTWAYLRGQGTPRQSTGHTPLGALSVLALLLVLLAQVSTGLISDDEISFFGPLTRYVSGDTVSMATRYHKNVGKFVVLALVVLHILAIVFYRIARRQDLVGPMITGDKRVDADLPASQDTTAHRVGALLIWLTCAGLVYSMVWFAERGGL